MAISIAQPCFNFFIRFDRLPQNEDYKEGDSRYIAPEILQNRFSKAADIFSLGITMLELASKLYMPQNGYLWHYLRTGHLPEKDLQRKPLLQRLFEADFYPHFCYWINFRFVIRSV